MRCLLTASALVVLAVLTTAVTGQPPAPDKKPAGEKTLGEKADKKSADPTDAGLAAALANDPDVRVAKAKIQLAEAELAKARQAVTLRVLTVRAAVDENKVAVAQWEERAAWAERMVKTGHMTQAQAAAEREKLASVKIALARAEAEWKLLTGSAPGAGAADPTHAQSAAAALQRIDMYLAPSAMEFDRFVRYYMGMRELAERTAVKGPIPDRIRAALDKPVKLGAKGEKMTFEKALAAFKRDAGLDVPVRGTYPSRTVLNPQKTNEFLNQPIEVVSEGEEMPVGAWFQLFEDSAVFAQRGGAATRYRFYVREYGLLISSTDTAPPDAPALTEFWKQKPPAKDAKPDSAPAPTPK